MRRGLSHEQVAIVLRRAAELDRQLGLAGEPGIDEEAVEQAAVEAGLSAEAVHRALAELRSGVLESPARRQRGLLGPPTLTVCRTVRGPMGQVERALHAFLRDQLFELRRDRGSSTTWIRRRDLQAFTRRAIDSAVQRRIVLREVHAVDLTLAQQGGDGVLVRLDLDVLAIRHKQGTISGTTAVTGTGMALVSFAVAGLEPAFLMTGAAGAGLMGVGHWAGRRLYRDRVGEIESGVNGMLDRLERGPQQQRPPATHGLSP